MTPNVIDLYHGDTVNDFAAMKAAGILGVIHKCTQGSGYADPAYATRREAATAAGLLWGAYTFNTGDDVNSQVSEFLTHAEIDKQTLMCLDFENNPHSQMSIGQAQLFMRGVFAVTGRWPILYSGNRIKDLLGNVQDEFFAARRLWIAQYGPRAVLQASWKNYWLWQYSETGSIAGATGAVDTNFYPNSPEQLATEWAT